MGRSRWMPIVVTGAVAAALAGAAVVTADRAACDKPGSYVLAPHGMTLVGGCLHSDDLPVAPPPEQRAPARPTNPLGD
jgi:hypothetical protein